MGLLDEIKKEAVGNRVKIQSSEALELEHILNRLFFNDKNIEEETNFVKQVMTRGLESQERIGLHASAMLVSEKDFCIRAQVLSLLYKQRQSEANAVGLQRIFEQGNAIHEKWQRLLIRGGYGSAVDMDLTRIFSEYHLSYTPDIICEIPEFCDGKLVGEIKSVNTFQFQRMSKHPSAWKQCHFYMYLLREQAKIDGKWNGKDFTKGFVLNEDKNTQDFKVEIYELDEELIAPFISRLEEINYYYSRVLEEKKMVKRPEFAKAPTCKKCESCAMRDACWNIGMGRIKLK